MNNRKNLNLKLALACLSVTFLSLADVNTTSELLTEKKYTTIVGQNVGGGANNFLEFAIETENKDLNEYRQRTTAYLAPATAQLKNMSDVEMEKVFGTKNRKDAEKIASKQDLERGPSIRRAFPKSLRPHLVNLVRETSGEEEAQKVNQLFDDIHYTNFGDEKAYSTFCLTSAFLGTEKMLLDAEKKEGIKFQLPTLDNPSVLLPGPTRDEAKLALFKSVLSKKALETANADPKEIQKNLARIPQGKLPAAFTKYPETYKNFTGSGVGYNFLYAAQQATLVHMLLPTEQALREFNWYTDLWDKSAGDLEIKMNGLLKPALTINPSVYCTQEASSEYLTKVKNTGIFLPIDQQPTGDGSHIFLSKNSFAGSKVVHLNNYKKYDQANVSLVEGFRLEENPQTPIELFSSFHASSRNAQDRLDIMKALAEKAQEINKKTGRGVLLRVEGDANTDSTDKVNSFLNYCSELGFTEACKALGQKPVPTVAKMRIFSSQKEKEFKPDRNTKDFVFYLAIGLANEQATKLIAEQTGFEQPYNAKRNLPDTGCPADHYPKLATFEDNF